MKKIVINNDFRKIVSYGGTYFATVVGAGFASGQEVMQFYANYGLISLVAIIPAAFLFFWAGSRFMELGQALHTDTHKPAMEYLCGKYVGKAFDGILLFFMFGIYVVMISGGGTTMSQYMGVNVYLGRVIMVTACVFSISFGFRQTLRIGEICAPLMIISTIVIGLIAGISHIGELAGVEESLRSAPPATSVPNIWLSILVYVSYCVTPSTPVLLAIGNNEKNRVLRTRGALFGAAALGICLMCIDVALLGNFAHIGGSEIPLVELASGIWGPVGRMYTVILLMSLFTTAVAVEYGVVSRFAECGTKKGMVLSSLVGVAAFALGMVPFSKLIGTLYPIIGYIGFVVMGAALYKQFMERYRKKVGISAQTTRN